MWGEGSRQHAGRVHRVRSLLPVGYGHHRGPNGPAGTALSDTRAYPGSPVHEAFGIACGHRTDPPGPGSTDGREEEEKRQVDRERDPEGEVHRARHGPFRITDLAGDGGDQVEALESDEGVAHRLEESARAGRKEGPEAGHECDGGFADPGPGAADQEDREDDHLADRGDSFPSAG